MPPRRKPEADKPTQQTEKGFEMPVPLRSQVIRDLRRASKSKPKPESGTSGTEDER
jgi:hypothetical protein